MSIQRLPRSGFLAVCLVFLFAATPAVAASLVATLATTSPVVSASTVPGNGDLNPYGVAFVPEGFPKGAAHAGDILVANFNAAGNAQGTGTTIVSVAPSGAVTPFYAGPQGLGLSTALGVLRRGFVLVGNVPSLDGSGVCSEGADGSEQGVGRGSLLVLDRWGHLLTSLRSDEFLDGPWDLTLVDEGARAAVFVSNVLNGSVARIDLALDADGDHVSVLGMTRIASGYLHRCDPAAFVVGPTGLALDRDQDLLYVAATADNAIYAVRNPLSRRHDGGTGELVTSDPVHLHGPVGLLLAPNGDLVSTQGDAVNADAAHSSEFVEYTAGGSFVAEFSIDPAAGSAFGLALVANGDDVRFAAVDDGQNVLDVWQLDLDGGAHSHLLVRKAAMASSTSLMSSKSSVQSGTDVTLTATVSGASPTGNVTFYDGMTVLGTQPLAAGTATLANVALAVGMHSLTAVYAGDANNATSTSAAVAVTVTSCTGYNCSGSGGGGGGGGYGGGALDLASLLLLALPALARRRRT
jgi:hypothetical protein